MAHLRRGTLLSAAAFCAFSSFIHGDNARAQVPAAAAAPFVHPPVLSQALPLASFSSGLTLCQQQPPKDVTGYFQVTAEQAARVDQMVFMELRRKTYKGKIKGNVAAYARQFIGLHQGDRSVIYVNAVLPAPANSVGKLANDCSGSAIYWGIEYDLSFERFLNFSVSKRAIKK
jgi:hypothetical protein